MTAIRAKVRRCGYCGEEKAENHMALPNLCVLDQRQKPVGAARGVQVKSVLQCLDCRERKTAPAFAIPGLCQRCIFERLPLEPEELADETPTLTPNQDIAQRVTDAILELLDQGKLPPWKMGFEYANPRNHVTGRQYQGVNRWILLSKQMLNEWKDSRWLTEKQARQAGGRVKDGETPTLIYFCLPSYRAADGSQFRVNVVRTHEVYNLAQTTLVTTEPLSLLPPAGFNPVAEAERIIESMPQRPPIQQHPVMDGPARYIVSPDIVITPVPELYDTPELYYETIFHELAHSTGHRLRLNRFSEDQLADISLHDRGREELTAEMTAAMLCEKAGIGQQTIENTAAYIQSWRDTIRAERAIILQASYAAEQALEFIAP